MQIIINMCAENGLVIPVNYNHQLQSAIYAKLREVGESDFWHDYGFTGQKLYKEFIFGMIEGAYRVENKKIYFSESISLELRSPLYPFCDAFQRSLELNPRIKLFDTWLRVNDACLLNRHINANEAVFSTKSPVVVYSTEPDGHTRFYGPDDADFCERLIANYERKYHALTGDVPDRIKIETIGKHKHVVTKFKNTWINGWRGKFLVSGSNRALEFLYNTGLGSKNSQGFGMVEAE